MPTGLESFHVKVQTGLQLASDSEENPVGQKTRHRYQVTTAKKAAARTT